MKRTFFIIALTLLCSIVSAFELTPRIFPAGTTATLRLKARSKWAKEWLKMAAELQSQGKHKVKRPGREYPLIGYFRHDRRHSTSEKFQEYGYPEELEFKIEGNEVITTVKLNGIEIHGIYFSMPGQTRKGRSRGQLVRLMTLDEEGLKLRPYKGNVHQHSIISGHAKHSPEDQIGYSRIAGFDYIAVTDHNRFEQNPRVLKANEDSKSGLAVYTGEELHTPGAVFHGLSIGATKMHSFRQRRTPEWNKAVQPILDELKKEYPKADEFDLRVIAESLLLIRRAKADGAFVAYCHPGSGTLIRGNNFIMSRHLIKSGELHAVEIVNGSLLGKNLFGNTENMAQLYELTAEFGRKIPVISSSDCHDVARANLRNCYNIIFAPDCTFPSFKAAVTGFRSVATYENGAKRPPYSPVYFGPLKYVRYANFLDNTGYWPKHDKLAKKQGELLLKYHRDGDKSLLPQIRKLGKQIDDLRESLYYKPAK